MNDDWLKPLPSRDGAPLGGAMERVSSRGTFAYGVSPCAFSVETKPLSISAWSDL